MRYTTLQTGRFIAAAVVVVFHAAVHGRDYLGVATPLADPVPAYYFSTAVVFFFALSGFVLAHGLQTASLAGFLRGRFLRLYPAYWLAAATVLAVRQAAGNQIAFDTKGLWYAFTLWPAGPNRAGYSVGIEWTLVYEVFLSLALVPFAAVHRRWGLGIGSVIWLAVLYGKAILDGGRTLLPFPRPSEIPLSIVNASFLLGVLVYLLRERLTRFRTPLPFLAAAALTGGSLFVGTRNGAALGLQAIGTALTVGYFATGPQQEATHPLVRAGDWSYGIYLMHVPVMTAFFALSTTHSWFLPSTNVVIVGGVLSLAVGAGYGALEWSLYRRYRSWFGNLRIILRPTKLGLPAPTSVRRAA